MRRKSREAERCWVREKRRRKTANVCTRSWPQEELAERPVWLESSIQDGGHAIRLISLLLISLLISLSLFFFTFGFIPPPFPPLSSEHRSSKFLRLSNFIKHYMFDASFLKRKHSLAYGSSPYGRKGSSIYGLHEVHVVNFVAPFRIPKVFGAWYAWYALCACCEFRNTIEHPKSFRMFYLTKSYMMCMISSHAHHGRWYALCTWCTLCVWYACCEFHYKKKWLTEL